MSSRHDNLQTKNLSIFFIKLFYLVYCMNIKQSIVKNDKKLLEKFVEKTSKAKIGKKISYVHLPNFDIFPYDVIVAS